MSPQKKIKPDVHKKQMKPKCIHCDSEMKVHKERATYTSYRCKNRNCRKIIRLYKGPAGIIHSVFKNLEGEIKKGLIEGKLKQDQEIPDVKETKCEKCGSSMFIDLENEFVVVFRCAKSFHKKKKGQKGHKKTFLKVSKEQLNEYLKRSLREMGVGKDLTKSYYSLTTIFYVLDLFYQYEMKQSLIVKKMKNVWGLEIAPSTINAWIIGAGIYFEEFMERYRLKYEKKWHMDELFVEIMGVEVYVWIVYDGKKPISWHLSVINDSEEALYAFNKAVKKAGFEPEEVITDGNPSYLSKFEETLNSKNVVHTIVKDFCSPITNNILERFNGTIRNGLKRLKDIKSFKALASYLMGFMAYYIFLRPHMGLEKVGRGKKAKYNRKSTLTPARECGAFGVLDESIVSLFV